MTLLLGSGAISTFHFSRLFVGFQLLPFCHKLLRKTPRKTSKLQLGKLQKMDVFAGLNLLALRTFQEKFRKSYLAIFRVRRVRRLRPWCFSGETLATPKMPQPMAWRRKKWQEKGGKSQFCRTFVGEWTHLSGKINFDFFCWKVRTLKWFHSLYSTRLFWETSTSI